MKTAREHRQDRDDAEKDRTLKAWISADRDKTLAAVNLGISVSTMYRRLKRWGMGPTLEHYRKPVDVQDVE